MTNQEILRLIEQAGDYFVAGDDVLTTLPNIVRFARLVERHTRKALELNEQLRKPK